MTDMEISKRLALAIGWKPEAMCPNNGVLYIDYDHGFTRKFNYRDPAVIWRIAERFNAFPYALRDRNSKLTGQWNAWTSKNQDVTADTAAKAVALAVIGITK